MWAVVLVVCWPLILCVLKTLLGADLHMLLKANRAHFGLFRRVFTVMDHKQRLTTPRNFYCHITLEAGPENGKGNLRLAGYKYLPSYVRIFVSLYLCISVATNQYPVSSIMRICK